MVRPTTTGTTLIVGATGYVGRLITAALIGSGHCRLVLPVRSHFDRQKVISMIAEELAALGKTHLIPEIEKVSIILLPAIAELHDITPLLKKLQVTEIINCAGSVEYSNPLNLKEVNIDLTQNLIDIGKALDISRFIYISTAFSCGFTEGLIKEGLHDEPISDPTQYTSSKRRAEEIVTSSNLPYIIARPSVIIGDSQTGRYSGQPYGVYQLWGAANRFLSDKYRNEFHMAAPRVKLQVVHQDALQAGLLAAYNELPDNSYIHLVSRQENLPSVRNAYELWLKNCHRPKKIFFYDRLEDIPAKLIDKRLRLWLEFTAINGDISAYSWNFETTVLDKLTKSGLIYPDATLKTLAVCQNDFLSRSQRMQDFLQKHQQELATKTEIIEMDKPTADKIS